MAYVPRSTLARSGSTWYGPIYESNSTVWHLNCALGPLNWVKTNDSCKNELFEIELFDCLTVCKQMTYDCDALQYLELFNYV